MAKCIIEMANVKAEITCESSIEDIYDLWELLIKPTILGCGYLEKTVDAMMGEKQ